MLLRYFLYTLFGLLFFGSPLIVFSAEPGMAIIKPPNGGAAATIYERPGFTREYCPPAKCKKINAWPTQGEAVRLHRQPEIHPVYDANGNKTGEMLFYPVQYKGNGKNVWGYIPADYLEVVKEPPGRIVAQPVQNPVIAPVQPVTKTETSASAVTPDRNLCCEERSARNGLLDNVSEAVVGILGSEKKSVVAAGIPQMNSFPSACYKFIDKNGEIGPWGEQTLKAMEKADKFYKDEYIRRMEYGQIKNGDPSKLKSCFYNDVGVTQLCPNFPKFSLGDKRKYYAYFFAAIAARESSCDPSKQNPNNVKLPSGLFQLEFWQRHRKGAERPGWRRGGLSKEEIAAGEDICHTQSPVKATDLTFQFECATAIFVHNHCVRPHETKFKNQKWEQVFGPRSYWEELQPRHGGDIAEVAKKFPGCH